MLLLLPGQWHERRLCIDTILSHRTHKSFIAGRRDESEFHLILTTDPARDPLERGKLPNATINDGPHLPRDAVHFAPARSLLSVIHALKDASGEFFRSEMFEKARRKESLDGLCFGLEARARSRWKGAMILVSAAGEAKGQRHLESTELIGRLINQGFSTTN
jgi:hypothetical protein